MADKRNFRMFCLGIAAAGTIATITMLGWAALNLKMPPPLSDAERSAAELHVPVPGVSVILRFETEAEWKTHGFGNGIDGYAYSLRDPCEIGVRAADWTISAIPSQGRAVFVSDSDAMSPLLAHEILHCLRNRWHPPWSEIGDDAHRLRFFLIDAPRRGRRDE